MRAKYYKVLQMICENLDIQILTKEKEASIDDDLEFEYYTDTAGIAIINI